MRKTNATIVKKRDLIMEIPTCLSIERRSMRVNVPAHHLVAEGTIGVVVGTIMVRILMGIFSY